MGMSKPRPSIEEQLERLNRPTVARAKKDLSMTRVAGCEIRPEGVEYVVTKGGVEVGRAPTRQDAQVLACKILTGAK